MFYVIKFKFFCLAGRQIGFVFFSEWFGIFKYERCPCTDARLMYTASFIASKKMQKDIQGYNNEKY